MNSDDCIVFMVLESLDMLYFVGGVSVELKRDQYYGVSDGMKHTLGGM
jgi:hypothetical protein